MFTVRLAAGALIGWSAFAAGMIPGDARQGEELFQSLQCIQCHSFNGRGGKIAADLGRRVGRDFTPTVMAALMWNHAPEMWAAMRKQNVERPALTPEQSADLFAYFVSARYFDKPGDAGRGKQLFGARHCADCHGLTTSNLPGAPPVAKWESLADPVVLVQQMWNHGGKMRQAFAERKLSWSQLTGQELTDIGVYLQNLPETRGLKENFRLAQGGSGEELFRAKGCVSCHAGANALETRLRGQSITDIAAAMWNHQPEMRNAAPLTQEEMRQILEYIWARQYFEGNGNAERGKRVFAAKNCVGCHSSGGVGPSLAKGKDAYSDITMVSALWQHGPRMLEAAEKKKVPWPRFTTREMADVIAYLNAQ
jgi:mono/diheme cytochrome c family protein